jgi:serine phosphatase RsbU (regulator of sigma subunit)
MHAAIDDGDQIIFYTDGLTEAHNIHGEMFGTDRLDEALENCSPPRCSIPCCVRWNPSPPAAPPMTTVR